MLYLKICTGDEYMHKVTQLILEKRKLILSLCLLGVFVNLVLSKLCRGEFFVLVSKDYLIGIILQNIFWYLWHFVARVHIRLTHHWRTYELDSLIASFVCMVDIGLIVVWVPIVWFQTMPFDIIHFAFVWFMFYTALSAEADDLEDYFDS